MYDYKRYTILYLGPQKGLFEQGNYFNDEGKGADL
ncbi:MAG: hypothetical protein JWO06_1366 [Bacteroidota bacterium]|nr:hypothetical protein [Bacteroidota bacterium]